MTENEAIEKLKIFPEWNKVDEWLSVATMEELVNTCNNALEEIQKYRELGKIEFLTDMKSNYVEVLSDLRQYQKLGTIEELKEDKAIADELSAIEAAEFYAVISEWKKYQEIGTIEECQENKAIAEEADISGKWIPCSERLPEECESMFTKYKGTDRWDDAMFEKISDDVNVTVEFEDGKRKTKTLHTIDGKWKMDNGIVKYNVVAWQQLPKPYKGVDKN